MTVLEEIDQTGISPNHSARYGGRIRLFVLHTQEGNGDAFSLARFLQNPNSQVSYHYSSDDLRCVAVVDTDRASWSVLDANGYAINFCFAGSRASQSREVWLSKYRNAIDTAAWLFVRDSRKYGNADPRTLTHAEIAAGKVGGTDHYGITKGLRIGNHTDVGPNFPWDVFNADVERHKRGGTMPVATPGADAIRNKRNDSAWLGDQTKPPTPTPDGRGMFAFYTNGAIYWTASTGARPIPNSILADWGAMGYEKSRLGYPVTYHTVLNGPDGKPWGDVQGFEYGAFYRKYEYPHAISIWADIRNHWNRTGFENGPLGWPVAEEKGWAGGTYQEFEKGRIFWLANRVPTIAIPKGSDTPLADAAVQSVGYSPTPSEIKLTPVDGMHGGISHFATPGDASTRGRNMGISGEPADAPWDPWYAAMRFNYVQVGPNPSNPNWVKPVSGTTDLALKQYLLDRKLLVSNPANGKKIVMRPADWGPGVPGRVIDVSPTAIKALGAQTDDPVTVEWVDPKTPLGPIE